ncbi:Uncharacterised protein [Mycobacteroides abscessus subsp. abscessus]|nr:Uncharacterised protein [Mycobacteroides abscessus]SKO66780.1 Uncharacterised protein [Mycobacteroides abscessus subsp. abscessus]CPR93465.1 Uncharacterised protein [Mycobacteroides abscessus]CPS57983.1 Uncharacterised protein [Mycobacteroides abscessus]CPU84158.1 Uncharacterised protein [Mycobacteroides abscessus]
MAENQNDEIVLQVATWAEAEVRDANGNIKP